MRIRLPLALHAAVCGALALGAPAASATPASDLERDLPAILALVERHYFRPLPPETLAAAARERRLPELDPYSAYLDSADHAVFRQSLAGSFGGVGMFIEPEPEPGGYRIRGPFHRSPALAMGIRAGDLLVAVDGRSVQGRPLGEVLGALRGRVGTRVRIEVQRGVERRAFTLRRAVIPSPSIVGARRDDRGHWDFMLSPRGTAYLRITHFSRTTAGDVESALRFIARHGATSLVLDLRGNTGGLSQAAIRTADLFLDRGNIVTFEEQGAESTMTATPGVRCALPLAILTSPQTVSAAEIFVAALQDAGRAVVIGERTFGKGTTQRVFPVGNHGAGMKLTIGTFRRGTGAPIERRGPGGSAERGGVWPDSGLAVRASDADWSLWENALLDRDDRAQLALPHPEPLPVPRDPVLERALEALSR